MQNATHKLCSVGIDCDLISLNFVGFFFFCNKKFSNNSDFVYAQLKSIVFATVFLVRQASNFPLRIFVLSFPIAGACIFVMQIGDERK